MNFTDKTFEQLEPFERYFKTACDANWCPNPGRAALDVMAAALTEKDGRRTAVNHSCGSCILNVVRRAGFLYFADKAEREAAAAPEAPKPAKDPGEENNREENDQEMMRRIDAQVRVVRMLGSNGRGITETFWEVQKKRPFSWRTVATFGNATAALIHAKHIVTGTAE